MILRCDWSGYLGTIITLAAHRLKLLEMHPASSNNCISLSMKPWYLRGMENSLHVIGGPMIGILIWNRLAFPTSEEDLDRILSNLFPSKEKHLFLAS